MPKPLSFASDTLTIEPTTTQNSLIPMPKPANAVVLKPLTINEVNDFGAAAQAKNAAVVDKITAIAKTSSMDEMGDLLTSTVQAAKGYDPANLEKNGFFGLFKAKVSSIKMKFDTVDQTVNRLVSELDSRTALFKSRIDDLAQIAEYNKSVHVQLGHDMEDIRARADWMEQNIPEVNPNDAFSAQHRQDWIMVIDIARKRADDMGRLQLLIEQQDAQITQMKQNSGLLAQTFSDLKNTTVPALKSTFTLYIINMEQKKGADFANVVSNVTNTAIQQNAKQLGQNTVAINTALTRSNISIDTLKVNHDAILQSLNDAERIRSEMKMRLANEAPQLEQLSRELSARLAK